MNRPTLALIASAATLLGAALPASAQFQDLSTTRFPHSVTELDDGTILADDANGTYLFADWDEYLLSPFFLRHGKRCGADALDPLPGIAFAGTQSDCTNSITVPDAVYDPRGGGAPVYDIPVVFHVLYANSGTGNIPDARIFEQIAILNADFAALTSSRIQFHLATEDPGGAPTSGITRHRSNTWYNDRGNYASSIGWDTNRYLNIYTNTAGGNLGYAYVPNGGGVVGSSFDGVRLLWRAVGYTNYSPYDEGRTGTHEVGHYLGLQHTFQGGCGTSSCYASGDLCCDTNPESSPNYSACQPSERSTCGSQDPVRNYMDYSTDACMDNFTLDQAFRMRCTIQNWRVDLTTWETGGGSPPAAASGPAPTDGATGVDTSVNLTWNAASGATGYDVYFGTSQTPAQVATNQADASLSRPGLAQGQTYYWRVDSVNTAGTTTGATWSFTTTGGGTGGAIFSDGFESGSLSPNWSPSNNDARITTNALTGSFAAEMRRTASITTTRASGAATSATVTWAWSTSGYESPDTARAIISGGSGGPIEVLYGGSSWRAESVTVSGLSGSITVTFEGDANRKNERTYVDDVRIE